MVDLVVVKSDILKCFSSFTVDDPNVLSDHCNISFSLLSHSNVHVNQQPQRVNDDENQSGNIPYKYKWNSEYTEEYTFNMQSEEIVAQLDNLIDNLKNTPTVDNVNQAVSGLSDIFDSVCSPLFKKPLHPFKNSKTASENKINYYDDTCENLKQTFHDILNVYRIDKTETNRKNMVSARSILKKAVPGFEI